MLFNSYIFVLLFFPLCLTGYFLLNHYKRYTLAQLFLFGMSLWFYGFFNPSYLLIILFSIVINYGFTWIMGKTKQLGFKRVILITALLLNIGILFYYKYYDFFLYNLNIVFHTDYTLRNILLPLGISFFTFQQISYIIDAYRGEVQQYNFLQYASFVAYFPQLIAGPIVTHDELIPQFADLSKKVFRWDNFSSGLFLFVLGLSKKVLIADVFGNAVNWGFSNIEVLDTLNAGFVMLAYTIQIYFDFSGYCDMAIGIGRMMNIDLPVNFDSPYKALTITEFWSRWHKTLTRFFTKYIYIPLGGNRKGKLRTYLHVFIVFAISGLWHGANWTFIVWGILHGLFMVITRHWKSGFDKMNPVLSWIITFSFVNLTWVIFRADGISEALHFFQRLFSMEFFGTVHTSLADCFNLADVRFWLELMLPAHIMGYYPKVMTVLSAAIVMPIILFSRNAYQYAESFQPTRKTMLITVVLLTLCIMSFSGVSTFLYFNF
ncbi:MAG: MBOAT family protein [Oscillospiraceae bacterium]|nr:MBOAT family protein [Oscillospiraceae bacterium]